MIILEIDFYLDWSFWIKVSIQYLAHQPTIVQETKVRNLIKAYITEKWWSWTHKHLFICWNLIDRWEKLHVTEENHFDQKFSISGKNFPLNELDLYYHYHLIHSSHNVVVMQFLASKTSSFSVKFVIREFIETSRFLIRGWLT